MEEQKKLRALKAEQQLVQLKQRSEKRVLEIKEGNDKVKEFQRLKQLIQEQNDKEDQKQTQDTLNDRKQKLDQIRDLHKPITNKEIIEHQQKISEYSKQIEEAKQQEKIQFSKVVAIRQQIQYTDCFIKAEQDKQKLIKEEEQKSQKQKELQERQKQLARNLKDIYKPILSEEKQLELKAMQEKIHHKADYKKYIIVSENVRRKKYQKTYDLEKHPTTGDVANKTEQIHVVDQSETSSLVDQKELQKKYLILTKLRKQGIKIRNTKESNLSYDESIKKANPYNEKDLLNSSHNQLKKRRNYLNELRLPSQVQDRDVSTDWQRMAQNNKLDKETKNDLILSEAYKLEGLANRKEALAKLRGNRDAQDDNIDTYLIGAIRAKLQVLDT